MTDFLLFLGRFHVLALHLPIGIIIVAVVLDFAARRERYRALAQASPFLWGAAALSAVLTVALGYLHFAEGGFAGPSGNAHRLLGTATAVVMLLGWWIATRPAATWLKPAIGVLALVLVTVTGHYGGNLTHGSTFMLEYAPGFLRSLLGAERRPPAAHERGGGRSVSRRGAAAAEPAVRHVPQRRQARRQLQHGELRVDARGRRHGPRDRARQPRRQRAVLSHHAPGGRRRGHAGRGQDPADEGSDRDPEVVDREGRAARQDDRRSRRRRGHRTAARGTTRARRRRADRGWRRSPRLRRIRSSSADYSRPASSRASCRRAMRGSSSV